MRRRVVVTGLGAVTPVGNDVATTWRALLDGVSGASGITKFDPAAFPVRFACELKGFDPLKAMERKEAKRADPYTQYAVAAAVEAMADAGLATGNHDNDRLGVIVGSGIGGLKSFEDQHDTYRERGASKISPFFIPMFIADIAAGVVSMRFNARGPNYATVSACSTSAHAIGEAFRTIQYGDADIMICGGSEAAVTAMSIGGFANMTALSTRNDSPETASRPFDKDRDGFVMGEGAGIVVLVGMIGGAVLASWALLLDVRARKLYDTALTRPTAEEVRHAAERRQAERDAHGRPRAWPVATSGDVP